MLGHFHIEGKVFEPCVGDGVIVRAMRDILGDSVSFVTNDIDPNVEADYHLDACSDSTWARVVAECGPIDWVVTNPPFGPKGHPQCVPITKLAWMMARKGVIMLLRLSFLEPCEDRAEFLSDNPPSIISVPRISFTGDGHTDNVCTPWFVWRKGVTTQFVKVIPKS